MTTAKTLETAGSEEMRLDMMRRMPEWRERSRSGRRMRSVRKNVRCDSAGMNSAKTVKRDTTTIEKSSTFQPDLRNASGVSSSPCETILTLLSIAKTAVNA
eukprot:7161262-Prymnesium_polylepis.3